MADTDYGLTRRWKPLRYHAEQYRLSNSKARFRTVVAGRRSGKTELAKRCGTVFALDPVSTFDDPNIAFAAPTRDQAKRIFWKDLKRLMPEWALDGKPSETELSIHCKSGATIFVVGLDKPARIEGTPWDLFFCDEFGNVKKEAWFANIRPALDDRRGMAWLFGVPEGRNHYYDIDRDARNDKSGMWEAFHWKSAEILPADIIEQAKRELDPLTYSQEYEASFVSFSGRAYYCFNYDTHAKPLCYDPMQPLAFCLDFNVAPGTASVWQEQLLPNCYEDLPIISQGGVWLGTEKRQVFGSGGIGEVWIEMGSNTPMVCRKLVADWGLHQGQIHVYGDATGGNSGSAKVQGSDWDLVKQVFRMAPFADRITYHIPSENPREKKRVNAVNARFLNTKGEIHAMVDPERAPHLAKDFDGVRVVAGSAGEIDKKKDPLLTHLSDGAGYYIERAFPVGGKMTTQDDF